MKKLCNYVTLLTILFGTSNFVLGQEAGKEILKNGRLKNWSTKGTPLSWFGAKGASKDITITKNDRPSIKLTGKLAQQVQIVKLKEGTKYRISGWIYSDSNRQGCIGLRTKDYDWKIKLMGNKKPNTWKFVSKDYIADGTETYFYCYNYWSNTKEQNSCYYSSLSLKELSNIQ